MRTGVLRSFEGKVEFATREEAYGPFRQEANGDEVIQRDMPSKRYGIGVLHPANSQTMENGEPNLLESGEAGVAMQSLSDNFANDPRQNHSREQMLNSTANVSRGLQNVNDDASGANDMDLSLANAYRQSSVAISFLVVPQAKSELRIIASGGRYTKKTVLIAGNESIWWLRSNVKLQASVEFEEVQRESLIRLSGPRIEAENIGGLNLEFMIRSRPFGPDSNLRLLTISLINRTAGGGDANSLFQTHFSVKATGIDDEGLIRPYPKSGKSVDADVINDQEQESLDLLYRKAQTFAVGHGCAAEWESSISGQATCVCTEMMPLYETRSITPDIRLEDGSEIKVAMAPLAGLIEGQDGYDKLEQVVEAYVIWIDNRRREIDSMEPRYRDAADRHLNLCQRCADRMRAGIAYLRANPVARKAFQLANLAILMQQAYATDEPRKMKYDKPNMRFAFEHGRLKPDLLNLGSFKGNWRAFQIAFILMTLSSTANGDIPERKTVELIWFPTGGGKTEAYLGLAAFAMFLRRLEQPNNAGVQVLMRYTLRLLTTQQFVRASRLVCAMEKLRRQHPDELGEQPFSIGMWVGGTTTPNTREKAIRALNEMKRWGGRNPFIVNQCPWCGAEMGALDKKLLRIPKNISHIKGYERAGNSVRLHCPDMTCEFANGLPIYVIDEDVYEQRPDFIVGTVDKFALLAWRPQARALFGLDENGKRELSPPCLIIQDELHLISGPLGSMVGLYEAVIEELCTDRRGEVPIAPKIVSSTATTRRFGEQINGLYARSDAVLFPPPGLEDGDSFFSQHAKDSNGQFLPGRQYLGINAPGLGSMQTVQVRTFTALLQSVMRLPVEERDPWWTLLIFFNSLRELGTSLSLLQSDIPDYQKLIVNRLEQSKREWRRFWNVMELTGRADSEAIARAITDLKTGYPNEQAMPIDICLASNIIEVGVDIDRLSLMSVVGQPKTTAQYIQVTGRVGRRWWERPGLIVTLYSSSKPRDRSHFEKFRTYHEQLYAEVEPSSVTPFSPPALDRALHAIMVAYTRQFGDEAIANSPFPYPEDILQDLRAILMPRIREVNERELENFKRVFDKRVRQWRKWQRSKWSAYTVSDDDDPLMVSAGSYVSERMRTKTWQTPMSMRNVDAECLCTITGPIDEVAEE